MNHNKEIGGERTIPCIGDQLEDVFILPFLGNGLDEADLIGTDEKLTQEPFAADELDEERFFILGGETPVKVFIVVDHRLRSTSTEDTIGMAADPTPKIFEAQAEWWFHHG